MGVTRIGRIKTAHISGRTRDGRCGDKVREDRLRWFENIKRRDGEHSDERMSRVRLPGRKKRKRPRRKVLDAVGWCDRRRCRRLDERETNDPLSP